jgi:hypothetical protein
LAEQEGAFRQDDLFDPFLTQSNPFEIGGVAMSDDPELSCDDLIGQDTAKRRVTVSDETG